MNNVYGRIARPDGYFGELEVSLPCGTFVSPDVINFLWRCSMEPERKRGAALRSIERLLTPCNGLCDKRKHGNSF